MRGVILALGLLVMPALGWSAGLEDLRSEYSLQSWDERQGLPSGRIWAITQDRDGYLWLGTEAGLIRFDGVRFTRWTSSRGEPFPEALIVFSLRSARDGSLWLGFQSGGIGRVRSGTLERFGAASAIGEGRIQFIFDDTRGSVWAGGPNGIYQFREDRWIDAGGRLGLPNGGANDAFEDRAGRLWLSTTAGVFVRENGREQFEPRDGEAPLRFSEDVAGTLWVTHQETGFATLGSATAPRETITARGQVILHDRDGTMWLGTGEHGLWRWRVRPDADDTVHNIDVAHGLSSDNIRALYEDRDGNIWVGGEAGLDRLTARKIRPVHDAFYSLAIETTPDGSIWIATSSGLAEYRGTQQRRYGPSDGLPSAYVRALFTDRTGTLWVATDRGVARRANGRFEAIDIPDFRLSRVISLAVDAQGTLWLCDRDKGAFSWRNGVLEPVAPPAPAIEGTANFVYVDSRERLWLGYRGFIVEIRGDGQVATHALGNSIGSVLTAIHEDRAGTIWVGGSRGFARVTGDAVAVLAQPTALPGNGVFAITEDQQGDLWLGVSSGVLKVRRDDFDRAASNPRNRLRYQFYDASDGLTGVPPRLGFPGAVRRGDGSLWFITTRGASVISPQGMDRGTRPPMLRIESITANNQLVPLTPGAELPAGTTQLLFEYTAVNLTSPLKERFRYQLEGVDVDWVEAGTRREAFYANLRSGQYRLRVARAGGPAAPESVAVWNFSIRPRFYETAWFTALCAAFAGLMGWAAWQLRLRQLRRQFTVVFAERARMSQELHDTLLQNLAAIALHFDAVAAGAQGSLGPIKDQMIRLRRHLESSIVEARRLVWDLRSGTLEENGLPHVLHESGGHTFGGTRTRFSMTVSGAPRRCAPAIEHHLMRIAQEALGNAARYADATAVHLGLDYQDKVVRLEVSDNGRGLHVTSQEVPFSGHYGLRIMKERAEKIGATFQVRTSPGEGTRIEIIAPLANA